MNEQRIPRIAALTVAVVALLTAVFSREARADWPVKYRNVTAGGELRAGVYGRIDIGRAAPPPLIFKEPMVGSHVLLPRGTKPVYLYVPPGQVRKWSRHCAKWHACDEPVLFVRMDDSPSKLGSWAVTRHSLAAPVSRSFLP